MSKIDFNQENITNHIHALIEACEIDPVSFEGDLVTQIIQTGLKLLEDPHTGQIKVITRAIKEMRYAYHIFNQYKNHPCVSIFGSARTPSDHPDYLTAAAFSAAIAKHGWMCMTGGANGIMKAGLEGPASDSIFGLSIRLPFEAPSNSIIENDPKLINFRYFFTRKLMFMSHSNAMAAFPGGFGTLDELFEMLTLMQTGKANIIPIVLLENPAGAYWIKWEQYVQEHLLKNGWISKEDLHFYMAASSVEDAVQHILKFYSCFHSYRYVDGQLVIRLNRALTQDQIDHLNRKYRMLIASGSIYSSQALKEETDHLDLPRIIFHFTRKDFGCLRMLIDELNQFSSY